VVPQLDLMPAPAPSAHREAAGRTIVALVLLVVALSAAVRLVNLGVFPTLVFDEHYYVHDADAIVHGRIGPRRPSPWKPGDGLSLAHPPLGTLSIAAGILTLGNGPWGWRVPSAIAGTLLIALVYPLARRLGLAPRWALAALLLAASDTMLIVESRIGVLDPFVALWSAACIYCALRYVQSGRPARWLVLTGAAGGLALASKWSGALALAAAAAIMAVDWARERRARPAGGPRPAMTAGATTSGGAG
jgi:dolichyl-phosphate-mannose--protein O-mannosyl transferase